MTGKVHILFRLVGMRFGYMNGEVNIEKNIVQIYNDIMEGEQ